MAKSCCWARRWRRRRGAASRTLDRTPAHQRSTELWSLAIIDCIQVLAHFTSNFMPLFLSTVTTLHHNHHTHHNQSPTWTSCKLCRALLATMLNWPGSTSNELPVALHLRDIINIVVGVGFNYVSPPWKGGCVIADPERSVKASCHRAVH